MLLNLDLTTFKTASYNNSKYGNGTENVTNTVNKNAKNKTFSNFLTEEANANSEKEINNKNVNINAWDSVFKCMQTLNNSINIKNYTNYMAQTSYGNLKAL